MEQEKKGLASFNQLKVLPKDTIIKGIHQGRFESKKTPGYFFHVFKLGDDAHAYGSCGALDDKITEINEKENEIGNKLYAEIKFHGRVPSKKNPKMTYYRFTTERLVKTNEPLTNFVREVTIEDATDTSDIPF